MSKPSATHSLLLLYYYFTTTTLLLPAFQRHEPHAKLNLVPRGHIYYHHFTTTATTALQLLLH